MEHTLDVFFRRTRPFTDGHTVVTAPNLMQAIVKLRELVGLAKAQPETYAVDANLIGNFLGQRRVWMRPGGTT